MVFYVDSCIYLNLWKKEEGLHGQKFWKYAESFFEKSKNQFIYYSGFVLKELENVLTSKDFAAKRRIFNKPFFVRVMPIQNDYDEARILEVIANFEISFFDCLHIILTRKINAILITRDRKLIDFAKRYCKVARPEELQAVYFI